MAIKFRSPLI